MTWEELHSAVARCRRCPLHLERTMPVFGEGPRDSSVLFVGEGPGAEEDLSGRPFVGRSGRFLSQLMEEAGVPRESVFISNVVRCRPPGNRDPKPAEVAACLPWLERLIDLLKPEVVVTVGNVPSRLLLDTKVGITSLRGEFHRCRFAERELTVRPIFHPSYLLRNRSRERGKPLSLTLDDLRALSPWLAGGIP
ncbi:uracil-DNA glycosylase [Dethiosulfovibrio salsuginis]|nr:uracil-DNA glycosylase [Dethiosulfovibrio salsuginis]